MHEVERAALGALLERELGAGLCVHGAAIDPRHYTAYNEAPGERPLALVRPHSVDEVSAALALCNRLGLGVVPQGGLTGLAGGARTAADQVALSLERFNGIETLDADAATVVVRAGSVLQTVADEVDRAGFALGIDLGARGACQIGGNLATNAGGNRAIRFGVMRDQVLGIEAVLADGSVVGGLNGMLKNNAGYDLKHLFIGSEGTLGVITRAVLKLYPRQTATATCLCALRDDAAVLALWRRARAELPALTSFEVMWPDFYRHVCANTPGLTVPLAPGDGCHVLLECASGNVAAGALDAQLEHCLGGWFDAGLIDDAVLATSLDQAASLWRLREGLAIDELPNLINYDISLPLGVICGFVEHCRAALAARWPASFSVFFGHIGDSNLHIGVSLPQLPEDGAAAVDALVYAEVQRLGGSISAEHGIGRYKKAFLGHSRSAADMALMRTLKAALDPRGILNPGAVL